MTWTVAGTTLPSGDEPLADSEWPEVQQDRYTEHNPIALTGAQATINTFLGEYSLGADGASPLTLHFWCTKATRDLLAGLKRTTFTIVDTWARSQSVYLKNLRIYRVSKAAPAWSPHPAGSAGERFHVWAVLLGR